MPKHYAHARPYTGKTACGLNANRKTVIISGAIDRNDYLEREINKCQDCDQRLSRTISQ